MRKTFKFISAAVLGIAAIGAISCQKEMQDNSQLAISEGELPMVTAYAPGYTPDSKTVIKNETEVWWQAGDAINVFWGYDTDLGKFTSLGSMDKSVAIFMGEKPFAMGALSENSPYKFWGVYPYAEGNTCDNESVTLIVPEAQTAVAGSFDPKAFPSVAKSNDLSFAFRNVCGGLRFSVTKAGVTKVTFKGNNNENLAGKVKVSMNSESKPVAEVVEGKTEVVLTCAEGLTVGSWYYITLVPGTLTSGYTLRFDTATQYAEKTSSSSVEVRRGTFGSLQNADAGLAWSISKYGTANCYIVSESGNYKFNATVKGGSTESVGTVSSAEVLWESYGTSTAPGVGDLVNSVSYKDGYISFSATSQKGNAVIAAKDASGNILWSWHIWLTDQPADQVYNNNAGTMMDRNLGATSTTKGDVHALGLLYQWGRKDPFLSGSSISSGSTKAASTITWPNAVSSDESNGTISYAVAHPTTFIKRNESNYDWYYTGGSNTDNTRWQTNKGIYDPCPVGYRVPDGGNSGVWSKAFGTYSYWQTSSNWDGTNKGMDFASTDKKLSSTASSVWYPVAGEQTSIGGSLDVVGSHGYYWSCSSGTGDVRANSMCINYTGYVYPSMHDYRALGESVRCCKSSN